MGLLFCVNTLFTGICITLTCNLIGLTGYSWWHSSPYDHGLWRYCITLPGSRGRLYYIREDLINNYPHYFKTTVLLGVSCGFIIIAGISNLLVYHYRNETKKKIINQGLCAISMFIAVTLGFSAMLYAEVKLKANFDDMTRSWSNIMCWLGYVVSLITLVQSIIVVIMSVKNVTSSTGSIVQVECYDNGKGMNSKEQGKFLL